MINAQAEYEWFTVNSDDKDTTKPILNFACKDVWSIRSDDSLNESYVTLVKRQDESTEAIYALTFVASHPSEIVFNVGVEVKIPTAKNRPSVVVYPKNQTDDTGAFRCQARGFSFNFYEKELINFQASSSNISFNLYLVSDYSSYTHKKEIRLSLASLLQTHPNTMKVMVFDEDKWNFEQFTLDIDDTPKRITPVYCREKSFTLVYIDLVPV